ncbi:tannase-domain-containing protein [Durotheca rogersii]|uniref:tannase-domain-containing protein n=1 Tax=Durotheca rogersii TaxID=419775 RepID=UPI00221F54CE|nr:tannase-domain-containing protein [Durotheca rogersii]KAI5859616.1 tannase-domain-containing protein [Durotheca rogersii]
MRYFNIPRSCINVVALATVLVAITTASASAENIQHHPIARQNGSTRCQVSTFASALPPEARVERVEAVGPGGTFGEPLTNLMYPIPPTNLPELCAVIVAVASSATSTYRFGLFLPTEWSGRLLTVGNGGFGGGINWLDMGAGVQLGFAAASTDTGHSSTTGDARWAFNNSEARADWGYRAIHGTVSIGKTLVAAYYDRAADRSYYSGCSTGGRQGLKEVQISPESFDGALVGAPAWYTSHLNTWVCRIATYNWPADDPKHIDWRTLAPLAAEIVRQCDAGDGVADGIISAPEQCDVDFDALRCADESTSSSSSNSSASAPFATSSYCLSDAQIGTLRNVYAGYVVADTGETVAPGFLPGSEQQLYAVLNYSDASPYGLGYVRYFVLDDPTFTLADYTDDVLRLAAARDPGNATADAYDLSAFRDRGGKLLLYQGAADGLVPATTARQYYERAVAATSGGDVAAARGFFRRLDVPGMQHCGLSAVGAPWALGGASQAGMLGPAAASVPGFADAAHDALLALVAWVERGVPVDSVVATAWRNATDPASGVLRQRPVCAHPQVARWDGVGAVDDAASWRCAEPAADTTAQTPEQTSAAAPGAAARNPLAALVRAARGVIGAASPGRL